MKEINKKLLDFALALIGMINERQKLYHDINNKLKDLQGDFYTDVQFIDTPVYTSLISLLDEILGDELASYFIFECCNMKDGGSITLKNGKKFTLKTVKDLEKYLAEKDL